ncbi:MAG TPA: hypothetical protein VFR08_08090 [Candidatus Angelobacter sp.]|nr:hypothetical protein [Candidatus Angelobacter sp.]
MTKKSCSIFTGLCALALSSLCTLPVSAQNSEVNEKPPMYTYVANWQIPRAQWADMAKSADADRAILEKDLADGTIIGYGNDVNLVHQPEGYTHDDWWSSMSMAGLLNVLDQQYSSGNSATPVLQSATKHADEILVSRYYNKRSGSYKNATLQVAFYKLKDDAPDDAVDVLCKTLIVPLMEKLFADGTIVEYEIDTEAVHTDAPGTFAIVWVGANNASVDKFNAALREAIKAQPLGNPAFGSMVDFTKHRDELWRANGVFK